MANNVIECTDNTIDLSKFGINNLENDIIKNESVKVESNEEVVSLFDMSNNTEDTLVLDDEGSNDCGFKFIESDEELLEKDKTSVLYTGDNLSELTDFITQNGYENTINQDEEGLYIKEVSFVYSKVYFEKGDIINTDDKGRSFNIVRTE